MSKDVKRVGSYNSPVQSMDKPVGDDILSSRVGADIIRPIVGSSIASPEGGISNGREQGQDR